MWGALPGGEGSSWSDRNPSSESGPEPMSAPPIPVVPSRVGAMGVPVFKFQDDDGNVYEFEVQLMSEGGPAEKPERVDQYTLYHGS